MYSSLIIIGLLYVLAIPSLSLVMRTAAVATSTRTSKRYCPGTLHSLPLCSQRITKSLHFSLQCSSNDELSITDTSDYGRDGTSSNDEEDGATSDKNSDSNVDTLRSLLEKNIDSRTSDSLSRYSKPMSVHNMPRYEFTGLVGENYCKVAVPRKPIRRILKGMVVSDRGNKTIVVRVERTVLHKKYRKYIKKSSRIMTHDEENRYKNGDMVIIRDCRPISKRKFFETFDEIDSNDHPKRDQLQQVHRGIGGTSLAES